MSRRNSCDDKVADDDPEVEIVSADEKCVKKTRAEKQRITRPSTNIRRSTRSTRYRSTEHDTWERKNKRFKKIPKGRSRKAVVLKKVSYKSPDAVATVVTNNYVFHKDSYVQIGDIMCLTDVNGDKYYAQIRGLLTDQYCKKSAVITWLLPTDFSPNPNEKFDPATYVIGPDEETPRALETMDFVMHAPSDYYKSNTPYPYIQPMPKAGFIWANMRAIKLLQK